MKRLHLGEGCSWCIFLHILLCFIVSIVIFSVVYTEKDPVSQMQMLMSSFKFLNSHSFNPCCVLLNCRMPSSIYKLSLLLFRYAWTIAECQQCINHLGWKFTAVKKGLTPSKFWGLTRASLKPGMKTDTEEASEPPTENSPPLWNRGRRTP